MARILVQSSDIRQIPWLAHGRAIPEDTAPRHGGYRRWTAWWLYPAALAAALLVSLWPACRDLLRDQLAGPYERPRVLSGSPADFGMGGYFGRLAQSDRDALRAVADRSPADVDLQVAYAAGVGAPWFALQRLTPLQTIFPNRPPLVAAILRYATLQSVRLHASDTPSGRVRGRRIAPPAYPQTQEAAAFLRAAAAGERADPGNAYFPLMQAVGLFSTGHRNAAFEAIERAADRPVFWDYLSNQMRATLQLTETAYGRRPIAYRVATIFSVPLPHYGQLRTLARNAAREAVQLEAAGDRAQAMRLRLALMRCGDKVRAQSTTAVGVVTGAQITALAAYGAGGAPPSLPQNVGLPRGGSRLSDPAATWDDARLRGFRALARQAGAPAAGTYAVSVRARAERAVRTVQRGIQDSAVTGSALFQLLRWSAWDETVLADALWLAGLGVTLSLLRRNLVPPVTTILGILLALWMLALTMASLRGYAGALVAWVLAQRMSAAGLGGVSTALRPIQPIGAAPVWLLPVTIASVAGLLSAVSKRPLIEWLSRILPLATACLVLIYTAMLVHTLPLATQADRALDATVADEGGYYASIGG